MGDGVGSLRSRLEAEQHRGAARAPAWPERSVQGALQRCAGNGPRVLACPRRADSRRRKVGTTTGVTWLPLARLAASADRARVDHRPRSSCSPLIHAARRRATGGGAPASTAVTQHRGRRFVWSAVAAGLLWFVLPSPVL